jgi:hypothetical protein
MSAIQRKSATKKPEHSDEVQEIEIPLPPQPKKKSSSKQEPVKVVVDDDSTPQSVAVVETKPSKKEKGPSKQKDSTLEIVDDDFTPSVAVVETKPSKKGKNSAPKSVEQVEPDEVAETKPSKKGKKPAPKSDEQDEQVESEGQGEVVEKEKSKKQPPKSLEEQITDSVETLTSQIDKSKVLIELKEALQKHLTPLITTRKKELKENKEDESKDPNLQFLEKQKDGLKDEITILKSSIRELASVLKVIEKATKQLESKKKKSSSDPSEPMKERAKNFVPVSTDLMTSFIQQNQSLKSNDGNLIFEQTPETNSDGRFLVETTQLMQLIHAYIRENSLRKDKFIVLDSQLEPLFSAYFEKQKEKGIVDMKPNSASVMSVIYDHVEKKAKK